MRLSKGSSAAAPKTASVSADAVAEHARQTSLLLPGGLSIVGLFLFAPGGLGPSAAGNETSLLSAWREAARSGAVPGGCRLGGRSGARGVLLGADASSRGRIAAREVVPGASPPLRHAEVRFSPLLSKLVSLRAVYRVAARVEAPLKSKKRRPKPLLSDLLSAVAGAEAARARRSVALGAGGTRLLRPLDLEASVADSLEEFGKPEASEGGAREVVLLPRRCRVRWSKAKATTKATKAMKAKATEAAR